MTRRTTICLTLLCRAVMIALLAVCVWAEVAMYRAEDAGQISGDEPYGVYVAIAFLLASAGVAVACGGRLAAIYHMHSWIYDPFNPAFDRYCVTCGKKD